jgi:hypothetical protein
VKGERSTGGGGGVGRVGKGCGVGRARAREGGVTTARERESARSEKELG